MMKMHEFALDEIHHRMGRSVDGLLHRAAHGDTIAAAMIEARDYVFLSEGRMMLRLHTRHGDASWHGADLHVDRHLPDTLLGATIGRTVGQVVEVAHGGHMEIVDATFTDTGFVLRCREDPIEVPRPGFAVRMLAFLAVGIAVLRAYIPSGAFMKNNDVSLLRVALIVTAPAGMLMALFGYPVWPDHPDSTIGLCIATFATAVLWPPADWRRSVIEQISNHSVRDRNDVLEKAAT